MYFQFTLLKIKRKENTFTSINGILYYKEGRKFTITHEKRRIEWNCLHISREPI